MNKDKTELFHAATSLEDSAVLSNLGFQNGTLPIRYLGLPLLHRKLRKSDYSPLLDKVSARFNGWAVKCFSFSGRLQLISSVIYGLINFWMSAFALPKGCIKALEKLCNAFLWFGDIAKRTNAKVSWDKVCLPKSESGLGLRNLLVWNKVLSLKLVWLLFSKSGSLWVAWMKEHRLKRVNYWWAEHQCRSSWIWKTLLSLKPLVKGLLKCKIGDGLSASFWFDNWSPLGVLFDAMGSNGPLQSGFPITATVVNASNAQGWRLPSSRSRNPILVELRSYMLSNQAPSPARGPNSFHWEIGNPPSSIFSTKKTWNHFRPIADKQSWAKAVWFKHSVPKQAFTFWIANLDRLPVKARLLSWGLNISPICPLCNSEIETRDHLLLHCPYAEEIWHTLMFRLGQHPCIFASWSSLISWLMSKSPNLSTTLKRLSVQATIYMLWKERNIRVHDSITTQPNSVFSRLIEVSETLS